jgi:hypothetical protein
MGYETRNTKNTTQKQVQNAYFKLTQKLTKKTKLAVYITVCFSQSRNSENFLDATDKDPDLRPQLQIRGLRSNPTKNPDPRSQ